MALLPICLYPDPVLKKKAQPVTKITASILQQLDDMLETMYHAEGLGLAANQVGDLKRLIVIDVSNREQQDKDQDENQEENTPVEKNPLFFINPEITWSSEVQNTYQEGCLSIPEQYADITRPAEVKINYLDRDGTSQEMHCDGILATCIQHEIDHLNGVLFPDHLSSLKRGILYRKFTKWNKAQSSN